jgi:AhpD family alkylhydroperoxidase
MDKPILPFAEEPSDPQIREIYAQFTAALGFVPNLVKLWSQAPHLVSALVAVETALGGAGKVPQSMKELAMTRTSELNGCPYCKSFHRARLHKLGVSDHKMAPLAAPDLPRDVYTDEELAVLRLADEMTLEVKAKPATLRAIANLYGTDGAIELMAAVALLNFDNRMAFTAELPPDPGTLG